MKKKRIGILLIISLVMIMSVSAISAADANDTSLGEVSDTYIETTSIAYEQEDNATPVYQSESVNDVEEISESDTSIEVSNQKEVKAAPSAKGELLSASNDDVLKADTDCFYYYEAGTWHTDLRDAMDEIADSDTKKGTILVLGGTYTERDATTDGDIYIHFSDEATITIRPFDGQQVIFDGSNNDYLFWFENANCKITFNGISFTKGKATKDGGAIEISEGQLTLNNCVLTGNEGGRYGGAISVSNGGSFIANNCVFTNNKAANTGGAISCEDDGSVTLNSCYFEGNKVGNDEDGYEENDFGYEDGEGAPGNREFNDCRFKGHGSLDIDVDATVKSVEITPDIEEEDVNLVALYKDDS